MENFKKCRHFLYSSKWLTKAYRFFERSSLLYYTIDLPVHYNMRWANAVDPDLFSEYLSFNRQ